MIPIKTTLLEERPPEVALREWRGIMREAHADQGQHWQTEFLPRHFIRGAASRYGYARRTSGYQKRKARAFEKGKAIKRNTDLVFSGLLADTMTGLATIRGFPSRVTITMVGPRYISMRPYNSNQPDKAAEVTAVTRTEESLLSELLNETAADRLDKLRAAKTTKT